MANKGNIDPGFQAAPFFGASSHDPIEFTRRHNLAKYQQAKLRDKEVQDNVAKGLDKLTLDLKGWEDQEGFKELMERQDKAINLFMDLSHKGLNIMSPRTTQEALAFKAITDYHAETKQLADTWGRNKTGYDMVTEVIKTDAAKPVDEQKIDHAATRTNVEKELGTKGISQRNLDIEKLLVFKPQIEDMYAYVKGNKDILPKFDVVTEPVTNEQGVTVNQTREIETPQWEADTKKKLGELYDNAPEGVKNFVKEKRPKDAQLSMLADKEWFTAMNMPQGRQKWIDRISGGGAGLAISIFGQKVTTEPAIKNNNNIRLGDRDYTEHYDFNISKPLIGVSMSDLGAEVYEDGTWRPASKEGGLVTAQLNFYDPKTDSFIFTSTSDVMDAGVYKKQTFSVPRANLGKEVDNLPIKKDDGKVGTLKDIYGQASSAPKKLKLPENFWSKKPYIPKSK
jgi:hypothetical protein